MAKAKTTTAPASEQVAQNVTANASTASVEKSSKKSKAVAQEQVSTPAPAPAQVAAPAEQSSAPSKKAKSGSKKSSTEQTSTATSSPAPSQVATPATASTEQSSAPSKKAKSGSKKSSTEQTATATSSPAPAPAEQVNASSNEHANNEAESHVSIAERISQLVSENEQFATTQREISVLLKKATKLYAKESRELAVANARSNAKKAKRENDESREPCGIRAPTLISDSMCGFLGCPAGTRLPRTDVTKLVTDYIKKNNLQIQTNKRFFAPDAKLGAILGPLQQKDQEMGYGYFNLQRYLSPHFIKTVTSTVAVSAQ
jgi:chromatin remodeling complex protein RSC6